MLEARQKAQLSLVGVPGITSEPKDHMPPCVTSSQGPVIARFIMGTNHPQAIYHICFFSETYFHNATMTGLGSEVWLKVALARCPMLPISTFDAQDM